MNIKISGLRSGLNYNDMLNPITGGFIEEIEKKLGCSLVMSDIADYDCDLKLIFIQSGGSENLFLQNKDKLKEPYYLLTNGSNNSLCRTQILVKFEEDVSEILRKPCGNHHIVFYGHHAEEIRHVMDAIIGTEKF